MIQHSATWLSKVALGMIQFDFGKERAGAFIHLRELRSGIFQSCSQPHGPSHCPANSAHSFPPVCCHLEYSSPSSHGSSICFLQVASVPLFPRTDFPSWPCLNQLPHSSHSPTPCPILFPFKGLISTWKYKNCCSGPTGYLQRTG